MSVSIKAKAMTKVQLAKLEAARAEFKARKAAKAAHAAQPEAAAATPEELGINIGIDLELPSWKRVLCGFVLGVIAAAGVGYGVGMLGAYCIAGIMTLTASVGLQLFLSFMVWLLALYSSWKLGGFVGGKVFASVVMPEGLASRSVESVSNAASSASNKVRGWFTAKPAVAEFTGAHAKSAAA